MKIIYFGTGAFAVPTLRRLRNHIVLAVAQPDRPSGRGMRLQPSPVKAAALELEIPIETPEKSRAPEFVEVLRNFEADFILVASYGQILSVAVLESARQGGINLHGSILPAYRGAAPIQRSIESGDTETGITLMQMDRGMDTGDIIEIVKTPIGSDETYGELQDRLALIAADLAERWAPKIAAGDYARTPQDGTLATLAPKISREETELDLLQAAQAEYNRFRAFTPSPSASVTTRLGRLKLIEVRYSQFQGTPGTIIALNPNVVVAAGQGSLEFVTVQPEGKRLMEARAWANGARLRIGDNLLS